VDGLITQQVGQTPFLYKLIMQNLDESLLHKHYKERSFVDIHFYPTKKSRKKLKIKQNPKYKKIHMKKAQKMIQVDVKDQNDK
jgi:hypothetical protein